MKRQDKQQTDLQQAREKARQRKLLKGNPLAAESLVHQAEELAGRRRRAKLIVRTIGVAIAAFVGVMLLLQFQKQQTRRPAKAMVVSGKPVPDTEPADLPAGLTAFAAATLPDLSHLTQPTASEATAAQKKQVQCAQEHGLPVEVTNELGMRFRLIPPGTFRMGSPETESGRSGDEAPHQVTIEHAFYMGTFEVTQAQWEEVFDEKANNSWFKHPGSDYPVEEVTWRHAQRFARKLAEREGLPGWTYRLPTEAEWEYACRAGTTSPWHFGDRPEELFNHDVYAGFNHKGPEPVGQRRPNAWGLYNMHGNVWEWCDNLFYYYYRPEIEDPLQRSLRGGCWKLKANECRSASRYRYPPDTHANILGFRVIRVLQSPYPSE